MQVDPRLTAACLRRVSELEPYNKMNRFQNSLQNVNLRRCSIKTRVKSAYGFSA